MSIFVSDSKFWSLDCVMTLNLMKCTHCAKHMLSICIPYHMNKWQSYNCRNFRRKERKKLPVICATAISLKQYDLLWKFQPLNFLILQLKISPNLFCDPFMCACVCVCANRIKMSYTMRSWWFSGNNRIKNKTQWLDFRFGHTTLVTKRI